ncbi:hypothetical protein DFH08DRAFT_907452 [Mycena albidolilacea]|uniref:Uncharacterized protein n=1 Tax=Mycena albidolilacea TaxID=1033008 RepID=A0AAD6YXB3_9AGAR|nr:hypothetical protein DFH08DRAFT_907452 [Mycena albidolilacea]
MQGGVGATISALAPHLRNLAPPQTRSSPSRWESGEQSLPCATRHCRICQRFGVTLVRTAHPPAVTPRQAHSDQPQVPGAIPGPAKAAHIRHTPTSAATGRAGALARRRPTTARGQCTLVMQTTHANTCREVHLYKLRSAADAWGIKLLAKCEWGPIMQCEPRTIIPSNLNAPGATILPDFHTLTWVFVRFHAQDDIVWKRPCSEGYGPQRVHRSCRRMLCRGPKR